MGRMGVPMAISEHDSIAPPRQQPVAPNSNSRTELIPALARPAAVPARFLTLWAVYTLEVLIVAALRIPHDLGFFMFAFGDRGSWLVVQYLTAHGYRPTIDFGFPYGLLPVMAGRVWFAIFGLTPAAFKLAMVAGGVAMAAGMARFASAMCLSRIGQAVIIVALPMAIQSSLPSLSHMLEAVLLCLALGEHSRGNRGAALALATAACFAKPALAYLYGFLLLALIVAACCRRCKATNEARAGDKSKAADKATAGEISKMDWPALSRMLMPAAVTGALLLVVLGSVYGARPLLASLLPLNGMKIYKTLHFGFFTPWSRTFWDPTTSSGVGDYLGTIAPFWMGSTVWLALIGPGAGWRLSRAPDGESPERRRDEIILCCAVLQTLFVLRFFGPPASWTYYPYLLLMGVAATSAIGNGPALVAFALAVVALVPQLASLELAARQWNTLARSPVTAGLWAESNERAEWSTVARLIAGHHAVAVGVAGCAPLLAPNFELPIGAYLVPGEATPAEVERTIARIKTAEMVVRPASESIGDPISFWPEMTRALDDLEIVWKGRVYQVCRRRSGTRRELSGKSTETATESGILVP
jgi:hypothetical protein